MISVSDPLRDAPMFGSLIPPLDFAASGLRGEALSAYVQSVSEELRNNLDRAEPLSDQWSNRPLADALVDAAVTRCLARLAATRCEGEANRLPSSRLWNLLGDRLRDSWLVNRARTKPRGYAGDYQLLDWICEGRTCAHPLGGALDRFFQNQAAPHAVRARTDLAAGEIIGRLLDAPQRPCHVVSVGCGPAADVYRAAAMTPPEERARLHVTLLDVDPAALDFARERCAKLLPPENLNTRQANLMRLSQRPALLSEADLITCPGLFDYLEDGAAANMLELFWRRLWSGGRLLVGNFAPGHATRPYMEWVGNWYLIYRTRDDLAGLAEQAGIPSSAYHVTAERFGIDLFLVAVKS